MKRQIKFRGKRTDTGEWGFGDLIHGVGSKHGRMYILPVTNIYPKGCNELDGWEVVPETVGQFIGLLDKNKREVYDGDIIKDSEDRIGQVCWDDEFLQWLIMYGDDDVERCMIGFSCEVIGNVFDNPELLKGGSHES